jgi:hypothetical protein
MHLYHLHIFFRYTKTTSNLDVKHFKNFTYILKLSCYVFVYCKDGKHLLCAIAHNLFGDKKMPRFDGTGPRGLGSMTGGRRGLCTGFTPRMFNRYSPPIQSPPIPTPTYPQASRYIPIAPPPVGITPTPMTYGLSRDEEIRVLQDQMKLLEHQLGDLRKRLEALK